MDGCWAIKSIRSKEVCPLCMLVIPSAHGGGGAAHGGVCARLSFLFGRAVLLMGGDMDLVR